MEWIDLFPEPRCVPLWSCIVLSWSYIEAINFFVFPRSFYGRSRVSTVKALPIPPANVSDDELDTDKESDEEIIRGRDNTGKSR